MATPFPVGLINGSARNQAITLASLHPHGKESGRTSDVDDDVKPVKTPAHHMKKVRVFLRF